MKRLLLIGLVTFFCGQLKAACWANREAPVTRPVMLSNGEAVPVPTRTCQVEMHSSIGSASQEKMRQLLLPAKLFPITVAGKAVMLISFYRYHKSDLGSFNEVYIVVPASVRPHRPFDTIKSFFKALRQNRGGKPHPELILFHLDAWSNLQSAHLASLELWGIPSHPGQIDWYSAGSDTSQTMVLSQHQIPLIKWNVEKPSRPIKLEMRIPLDYHLYAGGFDGELNLAPVKSKGHSRLSCLESDKSHAPVILDGKWRDLLKQLNWQHACHQYATKLEAVQYLKGRQGYSPAPLN